jgi:hypothetical protein
MNQQAGDRVDTHQSKIEMAFAAVTHNAAFSALWAQSKWLDKLLIEVVEGKSKITPTKLKQD